MTSYRLDASGSGLFNRGILGKPAGNRTRSVPKRRGATRTGSAA
jgi:hypothetical protein